MELKEPLSPPPFLKEREGSHPSKQLLTHLCLGKRKRSPIVRGPGIHGIDVTRGSDSLRQHRSSGALAAAELEDATPRRDDGIVANPPHANQPDAVSHLS